MSASASDARQLESFFGLAALRIGVCVALLLENSVGGAIVAAQRPAALFVYPETFGHWAPLSPSWTCALVWLFRVFLVSALVGYRTQLCLIGLSLLGVPLLAAAQLLGPTVHNMHLLWFLVLLAAAPSGQVWSVDQFLRRRRRSNPPAAVWVQGNESERSCEALLIARLLLSCVYFFPGAWKLSQGGLAWASPQRLIPLFHSKWYQFDFLPAFRVDEHPSLLQLGGTAIMALELVFPLLVLSKPGRWTAFVFGLIFHIFSAQFLGIRFMPLWLCYGILIDWPSVLNWLYDQPQRADGQESRGPIEYLRSVRHRIARPNMVSLVGVVLLTGAIMQGARGKMLSWPFACYPTFHRPVADVVPDVLFVIHTKAGDRSYPSPRRARLRSQAAWGRTWDILGYYGTPATSARLHAYAQEQLKSLALTETKVTLYEVERSTRPSEWESEPRIVRSIGTFRLAAVPIRP